MVCPIKPTIHVAPKCGDCGHEWSMHLDSCLVCRLIELTEALKERERELASAALILRSATEITGFGTGFMEVHARFATGLLDDIVRGKP